MYHSVNCLNGNYVTMQTERNKVIVFLDVLPDPKCRTFL